MNMRKDIALILIGAVLAIASFGINWVISSAIDRHSFAIDEQLQDIDRYLTFSKSSTLEAFELSSSAKVSLAISQLMYFQILKDKPDETAIRAYNALVADGVKIQASSVTAMHAAATGKSINGIEREKLIELSNSQDQAQAFLELATLFNTKQQLYMDVAKEKVMARRELIIAKNQLASRRSVIGNIAQLIQLLGILIILAKDIVGAQKPAAFPPEELVVEPSKKQLAA